MSGYNNFTGLASSALSDNSENSSDEPLAITPPSKSDNVCRDYLRQCLQARQLLSLSTSGLGRDSSSESVVYAGVVRLLSWLSKCRMSSKQLSLCSLHSRGGGSVPSYRPSAGALGSSCCLGHDCRGRSECYQRRGTGLHWFSERGMQEGCEMQIQAFNCHCVWTRAGHEPAEGNCWRDQFLRRDCCKKAEDGRHGRSWILRHVSSDNLDGLSIARGREPAAASKSRRSEAPSVGAGGHERTSLGTERSLSFL